MSKTPTHLPPDGPRSRIFLVDDHPLVREWLGSLIERQADLGICGQAEDSASAFREISRLKPDVVIVDLSLQGESGLELIKQLQVLTPAPRILVLSMHDENFYAERALRAGARGYVMKRAATGKVIEAIRQILRGETYLSETLAARMAQKFIGSHAEPGETLMSTLSDREIEIFRFIGQGYENKQIAERLHISLKTVQTYCGRIKDKLALANATALTHEAVRWYEHEQRNA
jgi:DNA-binding NarL/FixJ family response regulator